MDTSRYTFVSHFDAGPLSSADKVTDLARQCLAVSWRFDIAQASEKKKVWSNSFDAVVVSLRAVQSDYVVPLSDAYELEGAMFGVPLYSFLADFGAAHQGSGKNGGAGSSCDVV